MADRLNRHQLRLQQQQQAAAAALATLSNPSSSGMIVGEEEEEVEREEEDPDDLFLSFDQGDTSLASSLSLPTLSLSSSSEISEGSSR